MGVFEVLLLAGGVLGLYLFNQARAAGSLVFYPAGVTGLVFEGSSPVVSAEILVQNPTNTDFTFQSFAASALSDGTLVGNVSNFSPVRILANSEGALPIKVRLLLLGVAANVIDAIQTNNIKKKLLIQGTVNANGVPVRIELEFEIGL